MFADITSSILMIMSVGVCLMKRLHLAHGVLVVAGIIIMKEEEENSSCNGKG